MIWVHTASMASAVNGPWLRACRERMMSASRSGLSTGPSTSNSLLMSPMACAARARSFRSWRIWSSMSSMRWRKGCKRANRVLSILSFEFLHEGDQCLNAFKRHGIVKRGPHSAYALVPLELHQPARFCLGKKFRVQGVVFQEERHIHARAYRPMNRCYIKIRGIEETVKCLCLANILRFDGRHAPLALEPFEHQPRNINGIRGRRVEHGTRRGHVGIVERRRADRQRMTDEIVAHDHHGYPGRAGIL